MNEYFEIFDLKYICLDYSQLVSFNKNKTINNTDSIKNLTIKIYDIINQNIKIILMK
jgi:hypothetical protein